MNVFENAVNKYIDERKKLFENRHGMKIGEFLDANNDLAIAFQKDICVLLNIPHNLNVMMLYSGELKKWFAENKEKLMPDNEAMQKIASSFYKNLIKMGNCNDSEIAKETNRNKEAAENLSKYVNAYGYDEKEFARYVCNDHPTLQQSMVRLMIATLREMSKKQYFDARNEAAVKASKIMIAALDKENASSLPLI